MTVSIEKVAELQAVANFWKFRVDDTRRQLDRLVTRQAALPEEIRRYTATLIDLKLRELCESQRGLRKAQANLGRVLELSAARIALAAPKAAQLLAAVPSSEPAPLRNPARPKAPKRAPARPHGNRDNRLAAFPLSEIKLPAHRPAV